MVSKGWTLPSLDEFARAEVIFERLEDFGQVTVAELVARFAVSAVTVRKDLEALEQRSMLRRVRGGAVSISTSDEGAFAMRLRQSKAAKLAIAKNAAAIVRDGDVLAMDASTSVYFLAERLLSRRDLMVVTNGLKTALLLTEHSTATVLMPGGTIRRASESLVGPLADVLASRGRIDKGFFGVKGVSVAHGLMELAIEEAQSKKYLADACKEVYGIFDSTKVGRFGLYSFAGTESVTALYTDDRMLASDQNAWQAAGVEIRTIPYRVGADSAA
jgi:DeoR/GlpR family transcriptional regulator of sugar metabolism